MERVPGPIVAADKPDNFPDRVWLWFVGALCVAFALAMIAAIATIVAYRGLDHVFWLAAAVFGPAILLFGYTASATISRGTRKVIVDFEARTITLENLAARTFLPSRPVRERVIRFDELAGVSASYVPNWGKMLTLRTTHGDFTLVEPWTNLDLLESALMELAPAVAPSVSDRWWFGYVLALGMVPLVGGLLVVLEVTGWGRAVLDWIGSW